MLWPDAAAKGRHGRRWSPLPLFPGPALQGPLCWGRPSPWPALCAACGRDRLLGLPASGTVLQWRHPEAPGQQTG